MSSTQEEFEQAFIARNLEKMQIILSTGFNNFKTSQFFESCVGRMEELLGKGTSVCFWWTFLHEVILRDDFEVFHLLIRYSTPEMINNQDCNTQRTPLHVACCSKNLRMVGVLITHGANTELKDKYGDTPFQLFIKCEPSASVVLNWTMQYQLFISMAESISLKALKEILENDKEIESNSQPFFTYYGRSKVFKNNVDFLNEKLKKKNSAWEVDGFEKLKKEISAWEVDALNNPLPVVEEIDSPAQRNPVKITQAEELD